MGEPALDTPITLTHHRVYIIPTLRGLGFVVLIALLLTIAFVYNNNLVYLLAFLLGSIFFLTILHTVRSLFGLVLQRGQSKAVFAGELANFTVHIDNPLNQARQHVLLSLHDDEHVTLPAFSKTQVTLSSPTQKRGWHEAGKITISSTFPFGLFYAWSPLRFNMKVLVYPKPASVQTPFPENDVGQTPQGTHKKGADDFYGLQEYQAGDAIKHIHWKAFAKGLGVLSKQYSGESSAEIWLDYDYTTGHNSEERLSQLCRWVMDAEQAGLRYGFVLPTLKLTPDNGDVHYKKCLEALALF